MQAATDTDWRIDPVGDRCLMIEFGQRVDLKINAKVHALANHLLEHPIPGVIDLVPAFTTVAIHYEPQRLAKAALAGESAYAALARMLSQILARGTNITETATRTIEIPVCYDEEFGPDLAQIADTHGLSINEVIRIHTACEHTVYMLGFAPGFAYMGGLDERLAMPRRSTPRTRIPAGTVAIAREQSAVYTVESPGGWNLMGRTPLRFFDPETEPPTLLRPGDRVRFTQVSRERYEQIAAEHA